MKTYYSSLFILLLESKVSGQINLPEAKILLSSNSSFSKYPFNMDSDIIIKEGVL